MPIISWLIRPILFVAAIIAGWFVASDAPNFSVVQMAVAVLLIAGIVAIAAFWETVADWLRDRKI